MFVINMDRKTVVEKLIQLNSHNPAECEGDLNVLCEINVRLICEQCNIELENIIDLNKKLKVFNKDDNSMIWKYICLNFYFLNILIESLDQTPVDDVLSVQHIKQLKKVMQNIVGIGICCNLQHKMPTHRELPTQYVEDCEPVLNSYNRLTATTYGLIACLKCTKLRSVILSGCFKSILSSLYQIIYCPLKKPDISNEKTTTSFIMTPELYERFVKDKDFFKNELEPLEKSLLKTLYVRETMLLPESNSPPWLIKAISQKLNYLLCLPKGIETIAWAMLDSSADYDPQDVAKNWKILDVITKLIVNFSGKPDFEATMCSQLIKLLDINDHDGNYIIPFVNLYVLCVKRLYNVNLSLCERVLLPVIFREIAYFTDKDHKFKTEEKVTVLIGRVIRILYSCFVQGNYTDNCLPIELMTPSINIIIYLYIMMSHSSHKMQNELRDIIIKYLHQKENVNTFFDFFLFDINSRNVSTFRDDIYLEYRQDDLILKMCDFKRVIDLNKKGEIVMHLCKSKRDLSVNLFIYLLNVLTEHDKYLKATSRRDLLDIENEFILDDVLQRKLVVYQLLSQLAEDNQIQNYIKENPVDLVKYLDNVLRKTLDSGMHKLVDCDSDNFQTTFTLVMILQALVMNSKERGHFKGLLEILQTLFRASLNAEFRNLLKSIIDLLANKKESKGIERKTETKSELEKAIDDVCDPLLPVRGHGLMVLSKLIENKDPEALERKNYILNIFQQNLKHNDSFIYLSAINGLAAMGSIFPDVVLNILTDEYLDFGRKDAEDITVLRMKLGEILVRITKTLGETAPKYKSLLLNTFMNGTKDDDHLLRASSLSNLGEICRVLGYKLGTIVTEVLVCVHEIITTDKAIEARRAAVTVIRQLLVGLEVEMITFLKDHILEIYRTLKTIYQGDKDEVMRLQAQLALEELNENVKKFLSAGSELQTEMKFVLPENKNIITEF